ncbi:Molybdenum cofactor guanylyltransferase [Planctomycetes bacterium Pan216]|uniref:Probable molybdenum cofactor guanylyltransferase n=1 Tax=Kolteria novifilia TaxID=2527975 RepID=A0A518AWZ2_9BACT|nr:Molybdenum cofactor guanylyltransferase [Planctomycetes bacterium Pan216]
MPEPVGGIVLCGGKSQRMGESKANLSWGNRSLLDHVCALLGPVVAPIVVVASPDQDLPPLAPTVEVVRDPSPFEGPLLGMMVGLASLPDSVPLVFVTACDAPLLRPDLVAFLAGCLGQTQAAVPRVSGRSCPLTALYRRSVLGELRAAFAAGERRPTRFVDGIDTTFVDEDALRIVDATLDGFRSCNTPEELESLRRRARELGVR